MGKSVNVRRRVREHFRQNCETTREHRIRKNTVDITVHPTPGEFGATVLELHHIKKHQPLLNKKSRKKEKHTIAVEQARDGYLYPVLSETNDITTDQFDDLLAVFASRKQARGCIEDLAEEYELCPRRLKMQTSGKDGPCFDYQLGNCRGACVEEEPPAAYNQRFRTAFDTYGVDAWPYEGAVDVLEGNGDDALMWRIRNWCLLDVRHMRNGSSEPLFDESPLLDRFNYDLYRRLSHFLLNQEEYDVRVQEMGNDENAGKR